jgi:hypothetical protein
MKVSELHAAPGKRIEIGCFDFASEAAQVGPAHIVGHNEEDIRSLFSQ